MLRYLLTRSLRETAFPQNEHQTTAPAYARRISARNWNIPSAYASAYALALLQFAYASLRNSGFGLREASYDTTLSTHVKGGLGRCSHCFTVFTHHPRCWQFMSLAAMPGATNRGLSTNSLSMGVSKNRGTPKWMVYNGKPY